MLCADEEISTGIGGHLSRLHASELLRSPDGHPNQVVQQQREGNPSRLVSSVLSPIGSSGVLRLAGPPPGLGVGFGVGFCLGNEVRDVSAPPSRTGRLIA